MLKQTARRESALTHSAEIHGPPFDLSKLPKNPKDAAGVQKDVIAKWNAKCKLEVKAAQREAYACPGLGAGDHPDNLKTYATCAAVVTDPKGNPVSVTYYTKQVRLSRSLRRK